MRYSRRVSLDVFLGGAGVSLKGSGRTVVSIQLVLEGKSILVTGSVAVAVVVVVV